MMQRIADEVDVGLFALYSGAARLLASAIFSPFSGLHPLITLIPISLLLGIGMLWIFSKTSNQQAIRRVKARLQAHLYEMRLFTDEPVLIRKAQLGLLGGKRQVHRPDAHPRDRGERAYDSDSGPVGMLLRSGAYSPGPRRHGDGAPPGRGGAFGVRASGAPGIAVETPAVWIPQDHEISWRVRAIGPASGDLELVFPSGSVAKSIRTGAGPQYVSVRRVSSLKDLNWNPGESRLPDGPVDWISINYPPAAVRALGVDLHWLIWLLALSMISALLLKGGFRVSF